MGSKRVRSGALSGRFGMIPALNGVCLMGVVLSLKTQNFMDINGLGRSWWLIDRRRDRGK